MLTKYVLHIGNETHALKSESIRNWDQIVCAYSRKDYNGVIRSFSSKFEFVGIAYTLLFNLYLKSGLKSSASFEILTMNDNWEWDTQFEAPLDFSTITWNASVLSISAIDNSLAALISAKKNTKYEFVIGNDIIPDCVLNYDRVVLLNSVSHEAMSNTDDSTYTDGSAVLKKADNFQRVPTYIVGNVESFENNPVSFEDETSDDGSCFLRIEQDNTDVDVTIDITYDGSKNHITTVLSNVEIHLMLFDDSSPKYNKVTYIDLGTVFSLSESQYNDESRICLGYFSSFEELKKAFPNPPQNVYAIIGTKGIGRRGIKATYYTPVTNTGKVEWLNGVPYQYGITDIRCLSHRHIFKFSLSSVAAGFKLALLYKAELKRGTRKSESFGIKAKIDTTWKSRAKPISIDALSLQNVASTLLNTIAGGSLDVDVYISNHDERINGTYLFPAESIRGLSGAKLYSSFKDFCEFMSTVFGYVYRIGEKNYDPESQCDIQSVYFIPRRELFEAVNIVSISNIRNLEYSVDKSAIYSNIEVGYDKQDYEIQCGRDEWNFTVNFTTGIDVSDKTLSLKSKYRADCYGFEFLAQKRAQDTTDDSSDNDVFFAYCKPQPSTGSNNWEDEDDEDNEEAAESEEPMVKNIVINRSTIIEGTLSDSVFNGEFTPHRCILANADLISAMGSPLTLGFASSDGNSGITVNGIPCNSNIDLTEGLFSAGKVSFTTGDISMPTSTDSLYVVEMNGMKYSGFISSLELCYGSSEAARYKLIVKEVMP